MKSFSITLLPASEGDCLWIEYGDAGNPKRILIDAGRKSTYKVLKKRFGELPEDQREFELLVISHVDRDHIEGSLDLLADPDKPVTFKDIWFNGYKHLVKATGEPFGVEQGEILTAWLRQPDMEWNKMFDGGPVWCPDGEPLPTKELADGMKLTLLSPTREKLVALLVEWERVCRKEGLVPGAAYEIGPAEDEPFGMPNVNLLAEDAFDPDKAEANGSSIAFLAEFEGKAVLFAADAHPDVLEASLKKLADAQGSEKVKLDAVKVSHHGSSHNTSNELLALIDCPTWLVSTNGNYFNHPSASAIARIVKHAQPKELVFNYRSEETKVWGMEALRTQWGYEARYPSNDVRGQITVQLI